MHNDTMHEEQGCEEFFGEHDGQTRAPLGDEEFELVADLHEEHAHGIGTIERETYWEEGVDLADMIDGD